MGKVNYVVLLWFLHKENIHSRLVYLNNKYFLPKKNDIITGNILQPRE